MPELPEVETMVRTIRDHVVGREIARFAKCSSPCRPIAVVPGIGTIAKRVTGETIVAVRRRAKRVVLDLSSGDSFVIEPRMTGLMLVADPPIASICASRGHLPTTARRSHFGSGTSAAWGRSH